MNKKYIIIGLVFIIFGILLYFLQQGMINNSIKQTSIYPSKVCFKQCFSVELAKNESERERGLMFRTSLDINSGMLFIFSESKIYNFWMKDTLIPLDMIWINENKTVVYIQENAQPCHTDDCTEYYPDKPALYVLEVNAGVVSNEGIKVGDKAEFK